MELRVAVTSILDQSHPATCTQKVTSQAIISQHRLSSLTGLRLSRSECDDNYSAHIAATFLHQPTHLVTQQQLQQVYEPVDGSVRPHQHSHPVESIHDVPQRPEQALGSDALGVTCELVCIGNRSAHVCRIARVSCLQDNFVGFFENCRCCNERGRVRVIMSGYGCRNSSGLDAPHS